MSSQHPGVTASTVSFPSSLEYSQETIALAELASRFITHLFGRQDPLLSSTYPHANLPIFITHALRRTKLHTSVVFAALVLLKRLKGRYPSAHGSSGHRLFISAYMISSKVMYDATYSNKSWCIIAQDIFSLREINQMESTMCAILDWELTVNDPILANFTKAVKADFGEDTSEYPDYPIVFVSRRAARALASMPRDGNSDLTCLFPGFGTHPMPSDSHLESTSSASPTTPVRGPGQETNLNIRGVDISPGLGCVESVPAMHPLKPEMFAYVAPSDW